mgnify:CR=1 FL=1
MDDGTGIPLGVVIAAGFLMVMIALATINFRLSAQKKAIERERSLRNQEELERGEGRLTGDGRDRGKHDRQRAIAEAIRRDSTLQGATSPEELQRLDDAAESIRREWQIRSELDAVNAEQQRLTREAEERAARQREDERKAAETRATELAREERLAQMPPVRRFLIRHWATSLVVASLALLGITLVGIQWWSNEREARIASELAEARDTAVTERQEAERDRLERAQAQADENYEMALTSCRPDQYVGEPDQQLLTAWKECEGVSARLWVASFPESPEDVLQELASDTSPRVREAVAANPNASQATLAALANDPLPEVRLAVINAVVIDDSTMESLAQDEDPVVQEAAMIAIFGPLCGENVTLENYLGGTTWEGNLATSKSWSQGGDVIRFETDCSVSRPPSTSDQLGPFVQDGNSVEFNSSNRFRAEISGDVMTGRSSNGPFQLERVD